MYSALVNRIPRLHSVGFGKFSFSAENCDISEFLSYPLEIVIDFNALIQTDVEKSKTSVYAVKHFQIQMKIKHKLRLNIIRPCLTN